MALELRPQQFLFEDAIRAAFKSHRAIIGVAPTGFGKGYVIADMCYKAADKGNQVLVVTNRRQIVKQIQAECKRAGIRTGVIMGAEELQAALHDAEPGVKISDVRFKHGPGVMVRHLTLAKLTTPENQPDNHAFGIIATGDGTDPNYHGDVAVAIEPHEDGSALVAIERRVKKAGHDVALLRALVEQAGKAVGARTLELDANVVPIDRITLQQVGFTEKPNHTYSMQRL